MDKCSPPFARHRISLNQELNKLGRIRNLTLGEKCNFEKLGSKNVIWKKFRGPFVILKGFSWWVSCLFLLDWAVLCRGFGLFYFKGGRIGLLTLSGLQNIPSILWTLIHHVISKYIASYNTLREREIFW